MNPLAPRQLILCVIVFATNGAVRPCASAADLAIANSSFESPTFADAGFAQQFITYAQQGGYGWSFTDASGIYNPPALDYTGAAPAEFRRAPRVPKWVFRCSTTHYFRLWQAQMEWLAMQTTPCSHN